MLSFLTHTTRSLSYLYLFISYLCLYIHSIVNICIHISTILYRYHREYVRVDRWTWVWCDLTLYTNLIYRCSISYESWSIVFIVIILGGRGCYGSEVGSFGRSSAKGEYMLECMYIWCIWDVFVLYTYTFSIHMCICDAYEVNDDVYICILSIYTRV